MSDVPFDRYGDVRERVLSEDQWDTPTLDTPDELAFTFAQIATDPSFTEVVCSGRELLLDPGSDNSTILFVAIDRPALFKRLIPGAKFSSAIRFDRLFVKKDAALPNSAAKIILRTHPRVGGLEATTTPNPTMVAGSTPTGANAQQFQGSESEGAAPDKPIVIAGKDGAGLTRVPNAGAEGNNLGATPQPLLLGGWDAGNLLRAISVARAAGSNVTMAGRNPLQVLVTGYDNSNNSNPPGCAGLGSTFGGVPNGLAVGGVDRTDGASVKLNPFQVVLAGQNLNNGPWTLVVGGSDGTNARTFAFDVPTNAMAAATYISRIAPNWIGALANAWNAAAVGAGGTSASLDTMGLRRVEAFGNTSAASTITVQLSQDNATWHDATGLAGIGGNQVAANGNFNLSFDCGARYVRLKSSAAVTITATLAAK